MSEQTGEKWKCGVEVCETERFVLFFPMRRSSCQVVIKYTSRNIDLKKNPSPVSLKKHLSKLLHKNKHGYAANRWQTAASDIRLHQYKEFIFWVLTFSWPRSRSGGAVHIPEWPKQRYQLWICLRGTRFNKKELENHREADAVRLLGYLNTRINISKHVCAGKSTKSHLLLR